MQPFEYEALPSRVVFGVGSLNRLPEEVERLGAERAMVLCTEMQREQAEDVAHRLGKRAAGIYDKAVMHVPIESAEAARDKARRLGADACIAVGGGSTVGLGKAIALDSALPIIAVPTTYSGSEMTPIWGLTEGGLKRTGRDRRVLPKTVVYDPELTVSLPPHIAGPSGMNAIAHCVEALYARDGNPIISLMAEDGICALGRSLPRVVAAPGDLEARSDALYGAWLAGASLGAVSMGIHHKLCHTLGGSFNLPHADVHTVMVPHATAYNARAVPEALDRVARALGSDNAAPGLFKLAQSIGAKTALKDIGMEESDLDRAAEIATQNAYDNPEPVTRDGVRALLQDAFEGRCPA